MVTVHQLMFGFDRASNCLIFEGELDNGYKFSVAFPIGHVVVTFDREAAALGYVGAPMCGAVDTIDSFIDAVEIIHRKTGGMNDVELGWFGSSIVRSVGHAVSSVAKTVAKPITSVASKAYQSTIKKVGEQAIKLGRQGINYASKAGLAIVRSKLVGTALAGAAVAFPAVGAPALAAWGAANRAVNTYDAARQGLKGATQAYNTVKRNAAALMSNPAPAARLAIAGLSSYRP